MRAADRTVARDRGQTLFLAPIGFIIIIILGMATLEVASIHLSQRRLDDLADSIASDAATAGFDTDTFRTNGTIAIDRNAAAAIVPPSIAISNLPSAGATSLVVTNGVEPEVTITLDFQHEYLFAGGLFGGDGKGLTAVGNATLVPSA